MQQLLEIGKAFFFIFAVWVGSTLFDIVQVGLIGEILVGMIFGPQILDIVPYSDAVYTIGQMGLMGLVFEGGMNVQVEQMKKNGVRALLVAIIGTIAPILFGMALFSLLGYDLTASIVAGTSLSSSSIGMGTRMLQKENMLNSFLGSFISAASIMDDVFSLAILSVITNLTTSSDDSPSVWGYVWMVVLPIIIALAYVLFGILASWSFPKLFRIIRRKFLTKRDEEEREECNSNAALTDTEQLENLKQTRFWFWKLFLVLMLLSGVAMALAAGASGTTFLIGVFVGGFLFTRIPEALLLWNSFVSPHVQWLSRIFFASIGFVIPVRQLLEPVSFAWGLLYALFSVLGKAICGLFTPSILKNGPPVGAAMVARGELGFVIVAQANDGDLISVQGMAIVVWALLWCTFLAPFAFRLTLKRLTPLYVFQEKSSDESVSIEMHDEYVT